MLSGDGRGADGTLLRVDRTEVVDDLEAAGARLGDVHVQPEVVLTRHHRRRPARAFGDLRVVEGGDHVVLPSVPASATAPAQSRSPRYRPEQALPPVNAASPGYSASYCSSSFRLKGSLTPW